MLGAITVLGDRFFFRFEEYVTADHAKHFILKLYQEFEDNLIVVLDGAAYLPELNPVEECWRQLQSSLSNRFFDSLNELTTAIDTALNQPSIPKVSNCFLWLLETKAYNEGSPIPAGESRRGELAYEVQTDAEPLYWVYDFLSISKPYKAFWQLR